MDDVRSVCSFICRLQSVIWPSSPSGLRGDFSSAMSGVLFSDIDRMVIGQSLLRRKVADASAYSRLVMKPKYPGFDCRWQDTVPFKCLSLL